MYDRGKELIWKNVRDIGFVAAMGKVKDVTAAAVSCFIDVHAVVTAVINAAVAIITVSSVALVAGLFLCSCCCCCCCCFYYSCCWSVASVAIVPHHITTRLLISFFDMIFPAWWWS